MSLRPAATMVFSAGLWCQMLCALVQHFRLVLHHEYQWLIIISCHTNSLSERGLVTVRKDYLKILISMQVRGTSSNRNTYPSMSQCWHMCHRLPTSALKQNSSLGSHICNAHFQPCKWQLALLIVCSLIHISPFLSFIHVQVDRPCLIRSND